MRILVTNDDGIESEGLHVLANAISDLGDVVIMAPRTEFSGSGASLGTFTAGAPIVRRHDLAAVPGMEAWSIEGPPGLCVMYAQLGALGEPFDLIVSGINPGQNVGWSVYHSGTIGAALTGRNRGASGLAVSLGFNGKEVEGLTWDEIVDGMNWKMAATVAVEVLEGMIAKPADEPVVLSLNIPNGSFDHLIGWEEAAVGSEPPRRLIGGRLVEDGTDHVGQRWRLEMDWGTDRELEPGTDGWLVANRTVSLTWLGHLEGTTPDDDQRAAIADRLDALLS